MIGAARIPARALLVLAVSVLAVVAPCVTFPSSGVFAYSSDIHPAETQGTATVAGAEVAELGFTLQSGVGPASGGARATATRDRVLSWQPSTPTQSLVMRSSAIGGLHLVGLLSPGTSSVTDNSPLSVPVNCYFLISLLGDTAINAEVRGVSDLLCLYPGTNSGTAPGSFRIRLDQTNTATLEWDAPGGQTRYELIRTRFDGSQPPDPIQLASERVSYSENIGDLPTCYRLVAFDGTTPLGGTDALCAAPVTAAFTAGAVSPSVRGVVDQVVRILIPDPTPTPSTP